MAIEDTLTIINSFHNDLKIVKEIAYDKCGFELTDVKWSSESVKYGACSFRLNGKEIEHRVSKITPTKTGQFVTIWKRNKCGIPAPFDTSDNIDFIVISTRSGDNFGQFIFPKLALADKGIITRNGKEGKRGIRVYPPWDKATNKQAEKSQDWQTKYFVTIKNANPADFSLIKKLFTQKEDGT